MVIAALRVQDVVANKIKKNQIKYKRKINKCANTSRAKIFSERNAK